MSTVLNKQVGPIGYGLMGLTWRASPPPKDQAFAAMSTALAQGANFWNGGEIYGPPTRQSCHLLNEYFAAHPEDADKVVLSVKGCIDPAKHFTPDGSEGGVRRSVENCLKILGGKKSIDIFEPARVDPNIPIEDTVSYLAKLVAEGKIGGIGLSEVRAETIRRAAKVHPIAAVEVELSLWATDILHNGVAATCAELGIPVVAYSPLGHGALTDATPNSNGDIHESVRWFPKFQDDVLQTNMRLVKEVNELARRKGVTTAQLSIAWVRALSGSSWKGGRLGEIIPIPGASTKDRVIENCGARDVVLTGEDMRELEAILEKNPVLGSRYPEGLTSLLEG